jgi:hypothetical protein
MGKCCRVHSATEGERHQKNEWTSAVIILRFVGEIPYSTNNRAIENIYYFKTSRVQNVEVPTGRLVQTQVTVINGLWEILIERPRISPKVKNGITQGSSALFKIHVWYMSQIPSLLVSMLTHSPWTRSPHRVPILCPSGVYLPGCCRK